MRGKKPKPTAVKIATGAAAHDPQRLNKREPKAVAGSLIMPSGMSKVAAAEWRRIVKIIRQMGMESPVYIPALRTLCEAYADYVDARTKVQSEGTTVVNGKGNVSRNPNCLELKNARDAYMKLLVEFGLTPSSKTRVCAESTTDDEEKYWFGTVG